MTTSARPSWLFVALMALLTSTTALGIDMMMASFPEIAAELSPEKPERVTLILSVFFLGLGAATFIVGPLSDSFGRKPMILGGLAVFALGAGIAAQAQSMEMMLIGRFIQGVGSAAPRVIVTAIVRDQFEGRQMASTMSLIAMIFVLVPGIAPLLGDVIAMAFGWRAVFLAFVLFAILAAVWFTIQQPETLRTDDRKSFRLPSLIRTTGQILSYRVVVLCIMIKSLLFGQLYAALTLVQPTFDQVFAREGWFPYVLGIMSLIGGFASLRNSQIVERIGMVLVVRRAIGVQLCLSVAMLCIFATSVLDGPWLILGYAIWNCSVFLLLGFVVGNATSLAMQPLGKMAGTGATVVVAFATLMGGLISIPVVGLFDATVIPMVLSGTLLSAASLTLSYRLQPDAADVSV